MLLALLILEFSCFCIFDYNDLFSTGFCQIWQNRIIIYRIALHAKRSKKTKIKYEKLNKL